MSHRHTDFGFRRFIFSRTMDESPRGTPRGDTTPRDTPRSERGTPRTARGEGGGETPRSARGTPRSPRPGWFKAKEAAAQSESFRRAASPRHGMSPRRTESPRRGVSPLRLETSAPTVIGLEPGQLSQRFFRSDFRGAARAIQAAHSGVATRVMFSPDYDGSSPYKPLPPRSPAQYDHAQAFVPTPDEIGYAGKPAAPNRRAAVEPWVQRNGNILTADLPADAPVVARPKPEGALGRSTADEVRAHVQHERFLAAKPGPRAHSIDGAGRPIAKASPPRTHTSAWVADTLDDYQKLPVRTHAPDVAGKSTVAFDREDDYLDNVGPRAGRAKQSTRWVPDSAEQTIYAKTETHEGMAVRKPSEGTAGMSSQQLGELSGRTQDLTLRPAPAGVASPARRGASTWKEGGDGGLHTQGSAHPHGADGSHEGGHGLHGTAGYAGKSSAEAAWRLARESLLAGRPKGVGSQPWAQDVSRCSLCAGLRQARWAAAAECALLRACARFLGLRRIPSRSSRVGPLPLPPLARALLPDVCAPCWSVL